MSIDPTIRDLIKYLIGLAIAVAGFLTAFTFNNFATKLDKVYEFSLTAPKEIKQLEKNDEKQDKRLDLHDHHINTMFNIKDYHKSITSNNN